MKRILVVALLMLATAAWGDEITFTFVNLDKSIFAANATELSFGDAENVLITNNTNGKSLALASTDTGHTGSATSFVVGPPLEADYSAGGAASVSVETGGHVFLSGAMDNLGRLEANYPNAAGAFLSRFAVESVDPAILAELGASGTVAPEGSVSLTLAETHLIGSTLHATLGGGEFTIETLPVTTVPEPATLLMFGLGIAGTALLGRRHWE